MSPKHHHFTGSPIASVVKSSLDDFATFKKVEVHAENILLFWKVEVV